ncbi:hypothetical protein L1987_62974 [Smallanthus sonchifolius]|uniref:Uncharacterized protein n=1 Tax=Smallanthus sonchifolius TaxID=185202 RepID=A0ACB9CC08_9ASTR|nr:hypothetical protein L1987_62974 [Smallanthus sonchifolius]
MEDVLLDPQQICMCGWRLKVYALSKKLHNNLSESSASGMMEKRKAFADLLLDPQQMLMASVAAALKAIGYEIEVCFLTRLFGVPGNHLGQQSHGFCWPYGPVNRHKSLRKIIPMKARMNLQSYHLHAILFMQQATKPR